MHKFKQHKKVCIISEKKNENIPAFIFLNTKLQCNKRSFFPPFLSLFSFKTGKIR